MVTARVPDPDAKPKTCRDEVREWTRQRMDVEPRPALVELTAEAEKLYLNNSAFVYRWGKETLREMLYSVIQAAFADTRRAPRNPFAIAGKTKKGKLKKNGNPWKQFIDDYRFQAGGAQVRLKRATHEDLEAGRTMYGDLAVSNGRQAEFLGQVDERVAGTGHVVEEVWSDEELVALYEEVHAAKSG